MASTIRHLRAAGAVASASIAVVACGTGSDSAGSCEELAGEAAVVVEELIAELDGMTLADMAEMGDEPAFLVDLEEQGEAIDVRQSELGCSDEQMTELLAGEIDDIQVEPGSMGALLVEAIRTDGLGVAQE